MADFKRILFPVDFSRQCAVAAPYVTAFARSFDAEIILLHVEILPREPYVWESKAELLKVRLNEFAEEHFGGSAVRQFLSTGDPAEEIVKCARGNRADLIMIPTHGRGPFRRFVLGSVTTKVLNDTPGPVWTSAHLDTDRPVVPTGIREVLCAVDLDDTGENTLRYAGGLARRLGANLTVAHAVPSVDTIPGNYMNTELEADLMKAARARLQEMGAATGASPEICVGAGSVAKFVAKAAKAHGANLVVIGRGGQGVMGRLRTHDYAIMRECECPVLSV